MVGVLTAGPQEQVMEGMLGKAEACWERGVGTMLGGQDGPTAHNTVSTG